MDIEHGKIRPDEEEAKPTGGADTRPKEAGEEMDAPGKPQNDDGTPKAGIGDVPSPVGENDLA